MSGKYANIIVDIAHEKVDRLFQYKIPDRMQGSLVEGMAVTIPFGKGNKEILGYVISLTDQAEYEETKLKEISEIRTDNLPAEAMSIRLAGWMKRQYGSTTIAALKTVLPVKQKTKQVEKRSVVLTLSMEDARTQLALYEKKHQTARARLLQELMTYAELPYEVITGKLHVTAATIRVLAESGICQVVSEVSYRDPVKWGKKSGDAEEGEYQVVENATAKKSLSEEQSVAVEGIWADLCREKPGVHLLYGITGSGKTEVYLSLIEKVVQAGRQAIVLIPEIALTYQTLLRFWNRFPGRVSMLHSRMSQGERYDQFERAKQGELDVIIGPRSALFTPFPKLGLIVIDEEHEPSYKSETMPKYHARETAIQIASYHRAGVVLGSATPSLESYYRAKRGEYHCYELTRRLTGGTLPTVYVVDLRQELREGNRTIFSRKLQELLEERLNRGEQSILFLNRRGYAGFVSCRACGFVMKCPHCDVSLSKHRNGRLVCHYCGYEQEDVKLCPSCGSKYILGFRAGTEQIEEQVKKMFPKARVRRMDADTTRKKESYEDILSAFANGEADVLIGTQMIVKGHDFPNVTLVGILAADLSLAAGDYRAAERTFELLTQAAGRAGRGERPGEVVIQSYQPEHYSIQYAARQDYKGFYEEELAYRELLSYPPVAHMLAIQVLAEEEEKGKVLASQLVKWIKAQHTEEPIQVLGPAPASVGKIQDIYRFAIYVRQKHYDRLVAVKDQVELFLSQRETGRETVYFDFDPIHTF